MKQYNGEPYIISITSFGKRLVTLPQTIFTLLRQSFKDVHIIVTISNKIVQYIGDPLKKMLLANLFELNVIADEDDLGPHTKYFYAMKKYGDHPIMTFDDDRLYAPYMVQNLVNKHKMLTCKSIISNCAIEMQRASNGSLLPYPHWCSHRLAPNKTSYIAMAEGFAGVLYPANCFSDLASKVPDLLQCKFDDDLWLKVLETQQRIPVTQSNYSFVYKDAIDIESAMQYNLHENQNAGNVNRVNMCNKFSAQLLNAFKLH